MFGMMALGGVFIAGFFLLAVLGMVALLLKGVLLLIFLPLRLLFGLAMVPFRLAGGLLGLVLLPVILVFGVLVAVLALVGGLLTLTLPLLPLAALVFIVWLITRANKRPAAV